MKTRENCTIWHEIKDHVAIYHEDYWDKARVVVWDPINQRELNLVFSGSNKDLDDGTPRQIHFTVYPLRETWIDKIKWKVLFFKCKVACKFDKIKKKV